MEIDIDTNSLRKEQNDVDQLQLLNQMSSGKAILFAGAGFSKKGTIGEL